MYLNFYSGFAAFVRSFRLSRGIVVPDPSGRWLKHIRYFADELFQDIFQRRMRVMNWFKAMFGFDKMGNLLHRAWSV